MEYKLRILWNVVRTHSVRRHSLFLIELTTKKKHILDFMCSYCNAFFLPEIIAHGIDVAPPDGTWD